MSNPLTMKLQHGTVLEEEDRNELDRLTKNAVGFGGREILVDEGDPCTAIHVLLSGWACRFKSVPGASRQIVAFMVPGDHSALHAGFGFTTTHGLCTLSRCEMAEVDGADLAAVLRVQPNLERAFRWSSFTNEAVLQEWLSNVGGRPAERRVAHLLCELLARLQAVGLASADSFELPLTQVTLGDALGLSPAHINRTLQVLRSRGLAVLEDGRVQLSDVGRLQKFAGFSPRYLNLRMGKVQTSLARPG